MQISPEGDDLELTFYCKSADSYPNPDCPTFYRVTQGGWFGQGEARDDPKIRAQIQNLKDHEGYLWFPDNQEFMGPWCEKIRQDTANGRVYRVATIVSEPLSDYHRWGYRLAGMLHEAGEEVRFVPRRLLSAVALPGNDFWLFDRTTVVFNVFDGADNVAERQLYTEPEVVSFCLTAFEAAWELGVPQPGYNPS